MSDLASAETTILRDHVLKPIHWGLYARAHRGYYVPGLSGFGLAVTQRGAGANMSVDVATGSCVLAGNLTTKGTTTNVAIGASDLTLERIDVIYIAANGTITDAAGASAASAPVGESTWQKWETPFPPDMSGIDGLILAEVLVRHGTTSIVTADIRMLGVPVL